MRYIDKLSNGLSLKSLKDDEVKILCSEIRDFIISSVNKTGGHLGSSLGTVELTVALHRVFNLNEDKLIWDIGHQSYAHKILTGRKDQFSTLRQKDGLSGFSAPFESDHDPFVGGHSSTSISSGFGLKKGFEMQGINNNVISIIGDAAIAAGMSFEAINHIGSTNSNMIVILNDNDMSISKPQGALSKYFVKIKSSTPFSNLKSVIKDKLPESLNFLADRVESITRVTKEANLFESLGFIYIGVVDGHDLDMLHDTFKSIKNNTFNKPILVHVITTKGKGNKEAEEADDCLHGVEGTKNKVDSNSLHEKKGVVNSSTFVDALIDYSKKDDKIVAITAAMSQGTKLDKFEKIFPERFFDVGIAEQHAVTFAAGLAKSGIKPFVCIYSTFMQRAYDQVVHDVVLSSLPVRFILDRAGFVGADGATHHGLLDYSMFLSLPNIIFMVPSCREDIPKMVALMNDINDKPSFMRFAKTKYLEKITSDSPLTIGKGEIVEQGDELVIISIGEILGEVIKAVDLLKSKDNIYPTIIDSKFANPIDEKLIIEMTKNNKHVVVVEEGFSGAFFYKVFDVISKNNLIKDLVNFKSINVPSIVIEHASPDEQRKIAKIDYESLYYSIKSILKS